MNASALFPNGYAAMQQVSVADLLTIHAGALAAKQINSGDDLLTALCCDFEKVLHALLEMQSVNVDQVLEDFFSDHPESVPDILSNITDHELNHVGFEICEPLDIVEAVLENWLTQLSLVLGKSVTLKRELRFPASDAFRQRVGAVTDILCLWLTVDEQVVMLELFDIAHSVTAVLPSGDNPLMRVQTQTDLMRHRLAMNYLFHNDKIWHYSINVATRTIVLQLHEVFAALMIEQKHYKLAYPAPIQNQYDQSFHTKIINSIRGLELEFVTHHA